MNGQFHMRSLKSKIFNIMFWIESFPSMYYMQVEVFKKIYSADVNKPVLREGHIVCLVYVGP